MIITYRIGQFSPQMDTPQLFGADVIDYSWYPQGQAITPSTTIVFRTTFAQFGNRGGSRQVIAWGN